jgi:glycosyltransferase involved in cell wall biosynthesis
VLTVALDATPLLGARTGIGVAVESFFRSLAGRSEVEVTGYGLTARGWRQLAAQLPPGVRPTARPAPAGALLRIWQRADGPPGEWWTGRAHVVHGTNYVVPPSRTAARLVSVWDLTPVRYPELCTPTSRLYPGLVARALAGGAWVHTAAEAVADEIVEHFGVDRGRVRVVPPAVPRAPATQARPSGPPYVLGLGRTEPRKDFAGLVRAFDLLADNQPDLELRLAGPPGWAEEELTAAVSAARHRDRIRREGWVGDVSRLIAGAEVFAYPSRYEGFGLPPLEAMALGVPVVATSAGAVPEVVGPAAVLVEPGDPAVLASALEAVITDRARRDELVRAGRARAGEFSAERTAKGLISAYEDLAGSDR